MPGRHAARGHAGTVPLGRRVMRATGRPGDRPPWRAGARPPVESHAGHGSRCRWKPRCGPRLPAGPPTSNGIEWEAPPTGVRGPHHARGAGGRCIAASGRDRTGQIGQDRPCPIAPPGRDRSCTVAPPGRDRPCTVALPGRDRPCRPDLAGRNWTVNVEPQCRAHIDICRTWAHRPRSTSLGRRRSVDVRARPGAPDSSLTRAHRTAGRAAGLRVRATGLTALALRRRVHARSRCLTEPGGSTILGRMSDRLRGARRARPRRSLPLDRRRRFRRDVIHHATDAAHLVDDPARDPGEHVVRNASPVGGHEVLRFDRPDRNDRVV